MFRPSGAHRVFQFRVPWLTPWVTVAIKNAAQEGRNNQPRRKGNQMSHSYSNMLSHVIFSTKDRKPLIDAEMKPRLLGYMNGIVDESGGKVLSLNAMADHLHMLWELPPTSSLSDSMRVLKTNSSRWVHETWGSQKPFAWQTGYGAFSVSRSNVPAVAKYIEEQESHHRKRTFQEEFIELLVKHGIDYDPKYVFG
jgi:putative transposase